MRPTRIHATSLGPLAFALAGGLGYLGCSPRPAALSNVSGLTAVCPETFAVLKPVASLEVPATPRCGLPSDLHQLEWPTVLSSTAPIEREPPKDGIATVVLLPDTQYYSACGYPHLRNQSRWIQTERARRHIVAAISLGDLTDHNREAEWAFVRESFSPLPLDFPLLLTTGNHDTGSEGTADSRETFLSKYFDSKFSSASGALKTTKVPGAIENAFYSMDLGKLKLGVLMLEWSPRRSTVDWANHLLEQYADHRVIVATHAYLYSDSTRYDYATRGSEQSWNPLEYRTASGDLGEDQNYDGEMLWNALIRRHAGIFLVVSGHVLGQGTARLTSFGDAGNTVHQVLVNYQMLDEGGLGYLRFFEIASNASTLHMKTYSPSLGLYSYASDQDFRLEVDPPLWTDLPQASERKPVKQTRQRNR